MVILDSSSNKLDVQSEVYLKNSRLDVGVSNILISALACTTKALAALAGRCLPAQKGNTFWFCVGDAKKTDACKSAPLLMPDAATKPNATKPHAGYSCMLRRPHLELDMVLSVEDEAKVFLKVASLRGPLRSV